jgi:hypothetical protein
VRRGASEAIRAANFSKSSGAAFFGLPMVVTVSLVAGTLPMFYASPASVASLAFPASPTFPTFRENTPGSGEQADDGH